MKRPTSFWEWVESLEAQEAGGEEFEKWYAQRAKRYGLDPNPDSPLHFYDYRSAWKAGVEPDEQGHWPSNIPDGKPLKLLGHPTLIVDGLDTRTGLPADPSLAHQSAMARFAAQSKASMARGKKAQV